MNDLFVVYLLAGLNVFQFAFWAWQIQKLSNKLMCRNFAEYKEIVSPTIRPEKPEDPSVDIEEKEILDQLNGMLKPVEHI